MKFDFNLWFARRQLTASKRLRAYRKISTMLKNGTRIEIILDELELRASNEGKNPNEGMAIVYDSWRRIVKNGGRLAEAIDGWVPISERMIIFAGEKAGKLSDALDSVAEVVKSGRKINGVVIGGVAYPLFLLAATALYLYLFGVKVIPQFAKIIDPARWGSLSKSLYVMSQVMVNWGIPVLGCTVCAVVMILYSMPRLTGSLRVRLDKIPPYSIYRLVTGSGFMLAMSALLTGHGRVQEALETLCTASNPYLRERLEGFLMGVNSGMNVGEAMKRSGYQFPSKEIVDDLTVYAENSGDFSEAIGIIAREWMEEGVEIITVQMNVFKSVAMVLMATVLMWIVAGFFALQQEISNLSRGVMH